MIDYLNGEVPDFDLEKDYFQTLRSFPTDLIRRLRSKELDLSPVSSVEALLFPSDYDVFDNICISADFCADSVGVLSNLNPKEWSGKKIYMTGASLTSRFLLRLLCHSFFKVSPEFVDGKEPFFRAELLQSGYDGVLLIGDSAHQAKKEFPHIPFHDLGFYWHQWTGLPFVFALWLVRKDLDENQKNEVLRYKKDLKSSVCLALESLDCLYEKTSRKIDRESFKRFLGFYMSYFFTETRKSGMFRFYQELVRAEMIEDRGYFSFL